MKKLILAAVFAIGTLTAVNAQTEKTKVSTDKKASVEKTSDAKVSKTMTQDYKEVKMADVPQNIQDSFAKDYAGSKMGKAYLNGNNEYKFDVTNADGTTKTMMTNSKGEFMKEDMMKDKNKKKDMPKEAVKKDGNQK